MRTKQILYICVCAHTTNSSPVMNRMTTTRLESALAQPFEALLHGSHASRAVEHAGSQLSRLASTVATTIAVAIRYQTPIFNRPSQNPEFCRGLPGCCITHTFAPHRRQILSQERDARLSISQKVVQTKAHRLSLQKVWRKAVKGCKVMNDCSAGRG